MIKLKKIISSLHQNDYNAIERSLVKTGAENFLFLLRSYRNGVVSDESVISQLNISSNSFYVLKSRLHDRIQQSLSGNVYTSKEDVIRLLHQIPEMCHYNSREVATAFLEKLEKDLLLFDMHNELIVVYSALKKINTYSQKYFHYSQLFNKHIAFSLSLEKSDEILGNFNRALSQYNFSRSKPQFETLIFLRREISDHFALNPSRQIEIIKNFIELSLVLFCGADLSLEFNTDEKLSKTHKLINELPPSMWSSSFGPAMDFLFFEHFLQMGQSKSATEYYNKINDSLHNFLLYSNTCPTGIFLISKITFLQQQGRIAELKAGVKTQLLCDSDDVHSKILLGIYNAMATYYSGNYKEAITKLNELINQNSFKDAFHIGTEIKLTLAFFYITVNEYQLADNILKNIYRKIKNEKLGSYANVLHLLKVFGEDVRKGRHKITAKQKDNFALFEVRNTGSAQLLKHLAFELKKKYN